MPQWQPKPTTREPQCCTKADLYDQMARVLRMCEAAGFDKPWEGVRLLGVVCHGPELPNFTQHPEGYEFMLAIVEGRPVFRGDVLYDANGKTLTVEDVSQYGFIVGKLDNGPSRCAWDVTRFSWTPPKPATITINGVEVKRPTSVSQPDYEPHLVILKYETRADADAFKKAIEGGK